MKNKEKRHVACFICKLNIDRNTDEYATISDWKSWEKTNTLFCHKNCWRDHMSNKGMIRKSLENTNKLSEQLIEKMGLAE